MISREEKLQTLRSALPDNLESPFLEAEFFVSQTGAEWEPQLAVLQNESPFQHAFEYGRMIAVETEELQEEFFVEEDWIDTDDFLINEAEAYDGRTPAELQNGIEELYDEEEFPHDEEEEPLISKEVLRGSEKDEFAALSDLRKRLVKIAKQEWNNWEQGNLSEADLKATPLLRRYWVGYRPSSPSQQMANKMIRERQPWSAVFISYVMREAGAGNAFTYSERHTSYIAAAQKAAENQDASKFQAYDVSLVRPEVGDLICRDRNPEPRAPCAGTNFANVDKGGISHCDIVVEVKPEYIVILGGNTAQTHPHRGMQRDTVGQRKIRLDKQGFVIPEQTKGACKYFAIVKPPEGRAAVSSVPLFPDSSSNAAKPPAELVRFAQRVLNAAEYERLAVDGDLGPRTAAALACFRRKYNLGSGDILDAKTEIALAQRALEELPRRSRCRRGVFDADTKQALSDFKSRHGLSPNATLDAATRLALANALARGVSPPC